MSQQMNEFQKQNEEVFQKAQEEANNQNKQNDSNQIKIKSGEIIKLNFIWNPSRQEEVIQKVIEDKIEFKDNKPVIDETTGQKKVIGKRTRYYCPVYDPREPGVLKIWNASAKDFTTFLTPIKNLGKTVIQIQRFGEKLDTSYSYLPI